jgi:starch synthase
VAAENGALQGGKVGGVGDIVRDLPAALADKGWTTTILTPSYGMFHRLPGAHRVGAVRVLFRGRDEDVDVYEVPGSEPDVRNLAFEHALFSPQGTGQIYCGDEPARPYATDSNKFAFFAAAAATWIDQLDPMPDVVHLHDWHAATYAVLREFASDYRQLRDIHTVFTIHNLSYQGVRPLHGDESALETWFPGLHYSHLTLGDPVYPECYNPMAAAIRLADKISTVSPSYANEICEPSDDETGFIGGEGLEDDLVAAKQQGRLVGILNGCFYNGPKGRRPGWQRILNTAAEQVNAWAEADPGNRMHALAQERLASLPKRRPKHLLTSVGRLVRQKAALLFENLPDGRTALDAILDDLGSRGVVILLGSGEKLFEQQMLDVAARNSNVLFLCGYSETLADPLYRAGDLFLMPSSFEPCGISQMLAMRAAQPCVVHGVGGLKDTVRDNRSGFVFNGSTPTEQAAAFVDSVARAVELKSTHNDAWQRICIRAASARFSWSESAQQTIEHLYDNA